MIHDIIDIIRNTLLITGLVMVMLLIIEYINVVSKGVKLDKLRHTRFRQVIVAALLGLIPGCIGGFAAVSLFTHGAINFGALTAAMISAMGDEAFVMLATIPKTALLIAAIIFVIAIITGVVVNIFVKKSPMRAVDHHLELHSHDVENIHSNIRDNLRNITFERAMLIGGIIIFIVGIVSGLFGHSHDVDGHTCEHHAHDMSAIFSEQWLNYLFACISVVTLYIITKVSNHFLEEHLWEHIIKHHFIKIFLWTFGALLAIYFLFSIVDINSWISDNMLSVLLIALFIGLIPESGPNIIFITLFAHGLIPFSILLANTIVQDGHSTLPLIAESKRSFVYVKAINFVVGAIVGLTGYFVGF